MKKVTLSSVSHSARRRGCTLVVNLNPAFSFTNTIPAGTEALKGDIILHIPESRIVVQRVKKVGQIALKWRKKKTENFQHLI